MKNLSRPVALRHGILLVSIAGVLWGTVGIATQAIYRQSELHAVTVGFYRLAIAFPFVAALCWARMGRGAFSIPVRLLWRVGLIGAMLATYQVFFFAAIGYVGVAVATLITLCTAPVIVALVSVIFIHEPLTRHTLIAMACSLLGTTFLIGFPDQASPHGNLIVGVPLCLGSAAGYAIVALMGKSLAGQCHPLQSTVFSFGIGALCLIPLAAMDGFTFHYSARIWSLLVYVGVVPTAIAYILFFLGIHSLKASSAAILTMLEPLTATFLAWMIFGERLAAPAIIGALLLLSAIAVLYRGESAPEDEGLHRRG